MKKLFSVSAIALMGLAIGLSSCNEGGETPAATLKLSEESLAFEAAGGEKSVKVTGTEWKATVNQTWVVITPASGTDGEIKVTAKVNETEAERKAAITVTNAAGSKTVEVTQAAPEGKLPVLDPTSLAFAFGGETKSVAVTSDSEWTVDSDQTWLTVTKKDTGFEATAAANSAAERTATITVKNATGPKTVAVTQAAFSALSFADYLGNYAFDVVMVTFDSDGNMVETPATYNDKLTEDPNKPGVEAGFSNAFNTPNVFIDFAWDGNIMKTMPYSYDYFQNGVYSMVFVGGVLPDSGPNVGYIGFVPEFEVSFNKSTGELLFPQTLTHEEMGEWPAYYVVWAWTKADNKSAGRLTDFMTKVKAQKTGASAPARANGETVKIKMGALPAGIDANTIVKANTIAIR